jgi:hypothetical protein
MNEPLKQFDTARSLATSVIRLATPGSRQGAHANGGARPAPDTAMKFPARPDLSVLSANIPLFYIGRNKRGFWVVRESEGRSGGLFLRQRSAMRFARKQSQPVGCAIMFLNESFELGIENQGSRFVAPIAAAIEATTRRAPTVTAFISMAATEWRKLIAEISRAIAGERRNRAAIERELFHGEYMLSSKNDDDLPIPSSSGLERLATQPPRR